MKLRLLYIIFLISQVFTVTAQQVNIYSDTTDYLIGDYIRITIESDLSSDYLWPSPSSVAPEMELISSSPPDTSADSSFLKQELIYSVYDSGTYNIPSVPFISVEKQGNDTVFSNAFSIRVNLVEVDTTSAFMPIKDNIEVSYTDYSWLYYVFGAILLIVLGFVLWRYLKKKRIEESLKPKIITTTLSSYSLEQLDLLEKEKLWQNNEFKNYYTRLTDVLRHYLEQRSGIRAMEATTEEILVQLPTNDELSKLLRTADAVKFAKYVPIGIQCEEALEITRNYILNTTPNPDPEIELEVLQ